ncbi:MAG: hypothetical protein EA379_03370 [Phycisphaerales bacterium]|nr:MAG: hypothetical protein EA379_03370 [Phycisphaerales bacterium]
MKELLMPLLGDASELVGICSAHARCHTTLSRVVFSAAAAGLLFGAGAGAQTTPPSDESTPPRQGDAEPYSPTPLGKLSAGESPTSTPSELDDIYTPAEPTLDVPLFDSPLNTVLEWTTALERETGLRLGFAYTAIFQQASGGPNRRRGASGDFDIMGAWTLLGRGTSDTGTLVFSFEDRHRFGPIPASQLRNELGTLHPPTNGFNDRGWVVRDVYWLQRLLDDRVRFALGRGDVSDFVGSHGMQSLNNSFSNRALSANTTVPFPGHGMALGVSIRPTDEFYASVGGMNGYGDTTINDMKYLDEGDFFTFGEFGFTPHIEGLGRGRYRVLLWHMDAREGRGLDLPSDRGFSIILDQQIGESLQVFARYGYADEAVTNIRSSFETGLGVRGLLGSPDNMTGVAFAYTERKRGRGEEKVLESFHRWQLTRFTQFSLGVQGIFDPINSDQDAIAVFTSRLRVAF